MPAEALLRPQSAGSAILTTGSTVGTNGTTLYFKVQTVQFNLTTKVQDTTGDGDDLAHYDHDNELRGQVTMRGFMLADNHINFNRLITSTATEYNPVSVVMTLGVGTGTRTYKFKLAVSNVVVDWNRVGGLVGVAIVGNVTDSFTVGKAIDEA